MAGSLRSGYFNNGTIKLVIIDEDPTPLLANGHFLREYHNPYFKEYFLYNVSSNTHLQVLLNEEHTSHLHHHNNNPVVKTPLGNNWTSTS